MYPFGSQIQRTQSCPPQASSSRSHPPTRTKLSDRGYRSAPSLLPPRASCSPRPHLSAPPRFRAEQRHRAPLPDDSGVHTENVGRGGRARLLPRARDESRARAARDMRDVRRVRKPRVAPPLERGRARTTAAGAARGTSRRRDGIVDPRPRPVDACDAEPCVYA